MGPDWYKQPGCQSQPLFDIPLSHIVIDELDLMLRVMDRLEQGLILEVVDWDEAHYGISDIKGHETRKLHV